MERPRIIHQVLVSHVYMITVRDLF